ncbi:MAG: hypothetical protein BWY63_02845 [Chloroflexi bacterium ADurb.Bin360]|nr:MAG: hypothetical protein BWY63_02845 [Chloroflexi bacterium ADurb.Bin360]
MPGNIRWEDIRVGLTQGGRLIGDAHIHQVRPVRQHFAQLQVFHIYRIGQIINYGAQQNALARQRFLSLFARGDILNDADEVTGRSSIILQQRNRQADPDEFAILAQIPFLALIRLLVSGDEFLCQVKIGMQVLGIRDVLEIHRQ